MTTCYDFEGWGPASRIRDFDLTPCFEDGVILSPLLTGFLCAAIYTSACLYSTRPREPFNNSQTLLRLRVKLALLFAASCVSTTNLILAFTDSIAVSLSIPYILEPLWFLIAMLLTYLNHSRSRTSSGVILLFWPLYTGFLVVRTRTITLSSGSLLPPSAIIRCTLGLLGCASFVFEWRRPYKISHPDTNKIQAEIPITTANIYNRWSFSWLTPLMKKGAVKIVTENDLPPLRPCDESEYLGHQLENNLQRHSLWKALFIAFGRPYIVAAMLKLCQDTLAFLQPQLLRWLLAYISRYPRALDKVVKPNVLEGFSIALTMFLAAVIQSITLNQYFQRAFETGMRVRAGLVNVIYKKALLLSNDERARATGDIVNLMSVDATRLQDLCTYGLISLSGPFQITLAFMSLYSLLGWSAFVGVAIMVVSVPLNTFIARFLKRMQEQQMKNRDKRTRLMSELLNNIRSIKFYAWESSFLRKILDTRNSHELKTLRKIGIVTSCNMALWSGIPLLVAFSSFATAALTSSRPLTADVIFPSISLFMLLQFPLAMFSQVTSNIIEAMVSVRRLTDFLGAQEVQPDARKLVEVEVLKPGDIVLAIRHGEFSWSSRSASPTLENINLHVNAGELIGILGRVGAGKSSLLSAVIGDMIRTEGEVVVTGSIAYASQNPWIMSATVRHNIVFSHEYDEHFYNIVLEACALVQDLSVLPNGDLTEVGERGITLSGGQRARIALARAVYARADLVLLDDCLAAVDSHVARHVFDNVIGPRGLLSSKARILVTNSVTFASQFDQLAYLRRGIILENGSYDNLMNNTSGEVYRLIRGHGVNHSGTITPLGPENTNTPYVDTIYENTQRIKRLEDSLTEKTWQSVNYRKAKLAKLPAPRESTSLGLIKEHQEHGQVKLRVYKEYIKAASRIGFSLFTVATVAQQAASVLASLTLRYWGEHNREAGNNSGMFWYLLVYGLLSLLSTILGGLNAVMMWVFCALRSAQRLHDSMLGILLHAPLSYFELTPAGRILNLFSRDIYVVDQILPRVLQQLFRTLAVCLSIVAVIGGSFPPFLLFIFPLGWFYLRVMKFYLATSRELKRLDAVSRSPIFAWFSETLAGTSIIRAFDQTAVFVNSNQHRLDRNQICYLPSIYVNRWLAVRLEFVGALIILIVAMLAMLALSTTGVDAGLVGLVLSYALNTTSSLNWVVRSASEVEQNIVSVERILHQTEVKSEAPHEIPDGGLDEDWPFRGEIEFQEYSTRYRPELGLVLKEISLKICAGEKIGICGRTGAGKSSLLLALFRIIEPATGIILIDSVDVTKIGLHDLRSAISIVPQTPDLFEGTLRENIDPLGQYTDLDIWSSLEQAHLKDYIDSLSEKLDTPITEGGMSLSAGQRQLLCFTRALLRRSRILVLDEATSAVDLDTDQAIQSIIRGPAFTNVTILTIAHRLHTIMESDRILVMESGRIAEFSEPRVLLANKDSIFFSLAEEAGLITTDS